MIKISHKGNFSRTEQFLMKTKDLTINYAKLREYGQRGVDALAAATPIDTGLTAQSWFYEIERKGANVSISWKNSNREDGVPIAIILQYGHATRNGGYVQGRDYINPAIKPIFEEIAEKMWKEVIVK